MLWTLHKWWRTCFRFIPIELLVLLSDHMNTLWMEQNGRYFTGGILNFIFLNKNCCDLIQISLRSYWHLRQHWFRLWFVAEQLVRHYIVLSMYRGHLSSYNSRSFIIVIVVLCAISYHITANLWWPSLLIGLCVSRSCWINAELVKPCYIGIEIDV